MKLEPTQQKSETEYPSFRVFHATRRLAVGAVFAAAMTGCDRPSRRSEEAPPAAPPAPESTNSVQKIQKKGVAIRASEEIAESRMRLSDFRAELPELTVPTNSVKIPLDTFGPEIMEAIAAGKSEEEIMEMLAAENRSSIIPVEYRLEGEVPASIPPEVDDVQ
jgi:hypothetical protein